MNRAALVTALVAMGCSTEATQDPQPTGDTADTHEDEHTHGTGAVDTHIHNIQWWRDTREIVLATHEGTWRTDVGSTALVELNAYGDFMSMVQDPSNTDRYWGSGHWAAGGFGNWGFIESTDGAETWEEVSLSGQVDFHHMAVMPGEAGLIVGIFDSRIWVSDDAGRSWDEYPWAGNPTGMEIADPAGPVLWMASSTGIERLTLPSMQSEGVVSANVTGLDRHPGGLIYGTADHVMVCDDALDSCTRMDAPNRGAPVHMLLEDAEHCWVLTTESQVRHTEDGGSHWALVVDGV